MSQPRVGFIGLGTMGRGMAANLHRRGLLQTVWNRTAATAARFAAEHDCHAAPTPAALAGDCEVVMLCVCADADVLEVLAALQPGLRAGTVVIDCSTIGADTARQAAALLAAQDVAFLDCPVSGGAEGAREGTLTVMIGGSESALEIARPALAAVGQRLVHMGPVGAGQATKAVNQLVAAGIAQAATEGLAFAARLNLPLEKVIEVVGSGAAGSWFMQRRGESAVRGEFAPGFRLALHDKDLALCQQLAAQMDAQLPLVEMTRTHYRRLIEAGWGDADISALYLLKQAALEQRQLPAAGAGTGEAR